MSRTYPDRFSVDVRKRAAMARSRSLEQNLKELLANSLDAGATEIKMTCEPTRSRRRDRSGLRGYTVTCTDNGRGCEDPEILRTIGSSTSDLHPETRGRFGQGLIDVVATCETAKILTRANKLIFTTGCEISSTKNAVPGMVFDGILRHPGDGFDGVANYFQSVILPEPVQFTFNGRNVSRRLPSRRIENMNLQTIVYDPELGRDKKFLRPEAVVELVAQSGKSPMIFELGIPVDEAPWSLPYDINVLQKTPLDTERNTLPDKYKKIVIHKLVPHVSDLYEQFMRERDEVPAEIKNDGQNAQQLNEVAQELMVEKVVGARRSDVVRRNPFDEDDVSESAELEEKCDKKPVNTGSLPDGVRALLKDNPTVAEAHDKLCKAHFKSGKLPRETLRQRECMQMYSELATALLGRPVGCTRVMGGNVEAAWDNDIIKLNIDVQHLWNDPLGAQSLGTILHELAHNAVSGHSTGFDHETAVLGGKLAGWIGANPDWWSRWHQALYDCQK